MQRVGFDLPLTALLDCQEAAEEVTGWPGPVDLVGKSGKCCGPRRPVVTGAMGSLRAGWRQPAVQHTWAASPWRGGYGRGGAPQEDRRLGRAKWAGQPQGRDRSAPGWRGGAARPPQMFAGP
ncbi:hypothetical protein NDU88_006382 [Pleurodeles waltl]|uniref:Uncharacterized protein n=1 Tax=Pleurodeles waltl TaxID=8319 RepID=A0AAV7NTY5_PLEWA|nr:hypothetical protein NDU88_006382 [Pleurodeles waltl]